MKLTILGGGGVRTPHFIGGIIALCNELDIDRVCLMDTNTHRLSLIAFVAQQLLSEAGDPFSLECTNNAHEAIMGSDFVVSAIRVGDLEGRVIDETVPLRYGVIGQETTGPGGICMGLRTIPVMLEYAKIIKELSPNAWLINFTNPSGMLTQALKSSGFIDRVVGICDGPSAMFHRVAAAIHVDRRSAHFDYFGLNHLGWLRGVYVDGKEMLSGRMDSLSCETSLKEDEPSARGSLEQVDEVVMFGPEFVRSLGMIPNEYLYYYYYNREAVGHISSAPRTRGQFLLESTACMLKELEQAHAMNNGKLALAKYSDYIDTRHRLYMNTETGRTLRPSYAAQAQEDTAGDGGYERIALDVIRAIRRNSRKVMVLNTCNLGAVRGIPDEAVVEIPCLVDANGLHPLAVGTVPEGCLGLMQQVKECEMLACDAAITGSYSAAWKALALNPLVPSASVARNILDDYLREHGAYLAHIRL